MIAVVFGVQGVGKSSVVQQVLGKLTPDLWQHLRIGDNAFELAQAKGLIKVADYTTLQAGKVISEDPEKGVAIVRDQGMETIYVKEQANINEARDYMRNLNVAAQKVLQKEIMEHYIGIFAANPAGHFLVETHAALKTKQGYIPGLREDFLEAAKPDLFSVIEADANDIYQRRLNDPTRKRDHDKSVKDVQINLDTTRYFASDFAFDAHSPLLIVQNEQGKLEAAAAAIVDALERFI
jgi:adenylate kinase